MDTNITKDENGDIIETKVIPQTVKVTKIDPDLLDAQIDFYTRQRAGADAKLVELIAKKKKVEDINGNR